MITTTNRVRSASREWRSVLRLVSAALMLFTLFVLLTFGYYYFMDALQ